MRRHWRRLPLADRVILGCLIATTVSAVSCLGAALLLELWSEVR